MDSDEIKKRLLQDNSLAGQMIVPDMTPEMLASLSDDAFLRPLKITKLEFIDPSAIGEPIGIDPSLRGEMEFEINFDASRAWKT